MVRETLQTYDSTVRRDLGRRGKKSKKGGRLGIGRHRVSGKGNSLEYANKGEHTGRLGRVDVTNLWEGGFERFFLEAM